jgi:hypothetical protein
MLMQNASIGPLGPTLTVSFSYPNVSYLTDMKAIIPFSNPTMR